MLPIELECIIFDLDGTLVDSKDLHVAAWIDAFREAGVHLTEEAVQSQMGRRKPQIVASLADSAGAHLTDEEGASIIERKVDLFNERARTLMPVAGASEEVRRAHESGLKVVLATSATREEAIFHMGLLGIEEYLDAVLTQEDVQNSKPDPEIVRRALQAAGAAAGRTVMVGDSPHDMGAATSAGVGAVGVTTGGFDAETLKKAGADLVMGSVRGVTARLLHG